MLDIFSYALAFFIIAPFMVTAIVYFISLKLGIHPVRAFHKAINYSTVVYMISVSMMLKAIFGSYYLAASLTFILLILVTIVIIQWKIHNEILFPKMIKLFWRVSFLIYFMLYVIFIIIGILQRIFFY